MTISIIHGKSHRRADQCCHGVYCLARSTWGIHVWVFWEGPRPLRHRAPKWRRSTRLRRRCLSPILRRRCREATVISSTTVSQFCSELRLRVQEATAGNSFYPGHCSHAVIYAFSCVRKCFSAFPFVSSSVFGVLLAPTQVGQVVVCANA